MIEEVCAYLHNYFNEDPVTDRKLIYPGKYTIENGSIALPFLVEGQYFRVFGSKLNDGIHIYGQDELFDEVFCGVIWEMRVPKRFLELVAEIEDWVDKYGDVMKSPYQMENVIGVYQYTKMTATRYSGNYIATWQNIYSAQLKEWQKLR